MKTYRELYFRGTSDQLSKFANQIGDYASGDWKFKGNIDQLQDYLLFDYTGELVDKARVCIYLGDDILSGELRVVNIVPLDKSQLSIDEYNTVLLKFYDDIIKQYKKYNTDLNIFGPTDDGFDPKKIISETALKKLHAFCSSANKSTGSSHPLDRKRWFDFICQTVDDGKMFDYSTLVNLLQDETYWGKKPDDFIGVMGNYAWDEEQACELASEYENLCEILMYYKETRGI